LIPKARAALERYGHQVVIGNDLANRKWEVVFVERRAKAAQVNTTADDPNQEFTETWLRILHSSPISPTSPHGPSGTAKEIEEDIVEELVKRHKAWIDIGP
jgi:phosphopantothenate---cysteine ligase (ATP)